MTLNFRRLTVPIALAVLVGACATATGTSTNVIADSEIPPVPALDSSQVVAGRDIYQQSCASCHGADLAGQENWKIPDAEGFRPAPPQDSSGHTWHHSDQLLMKIVSVGLDLGPTRMPTFADQLSEAEIAAVLEFLKSSWGPDERGFQWQITWQESQSAN